MTKFTQKTTVLHTRDNLLKSRLLWIDYSKGIGIILVVYGHVLRGLYESKIIKKSYFYYSDNFVYSFHMPLFFILSGYFFLNSFKKDNSKFLINKAKSLLYPFVIWSLLQTLIEVLLNKFTNAKTPATALLTCLVIPRAQFWFLYALFFINCISFVFYKIIFRYALIFSCLFWLAMFYLNVELDPFKNIFKYLIFFNIGIFFSEWKDRFLPLITQGKWLLFVILLFAAVEYFYLAEQPGLTYLSNILFVFTGVLGSLVVMQFANKLSNFNGFNVFNDLGKASIGIYLIHIIVGSGTRIALIKILKIHDPVINVILGTVLGVTISYFVYLICMKRSYLSLLFKFPEKKILN
ncbi:fucose 4-O-acetylase-like acetyltransferase [Mucilaginibacter sp. UYNi724]